MRVLLSILISLVASTAMAGEFFMIDMEDVKLQSNQGRDTIRIKKELKDFYQDIPLKGTELLSVMMVAKTAAGKGTAQLSVGNKVTAKQVVAGNRNKFQASSEKSFDRVLFKAPANAGKGPWQIQLKGNFKVRQLMVEIDMNPAQKVVLEYRHLHVKTGQGDNDTLTLKAKAQQQHGLQMNDFEIVSATLFAKSRRGKASVQLKVGNKLSAAQTIGGSPAEFQGQAPADYYKIKIDNPKANSNGVWQMKLKGNIKIQKVVLEVKEK